MSQIASSHAVDVGQSPVGIGAKIQARHQFQQALVGAIRDRDRQRLFVEPVDVAADNIIQQPTQSTLPGVAPAHIIEFLLESAVSPQTVVLLQ
jgi:hypothetical protein